MTRTASILVHVPGPLRDGCGGARELTTDAATVRAVLDDLERRFPALYRGVCDETGTVRRHLNLYVNTEHIRELDGLETALVPGDEVTILPAVSGG